MNFWTRLDANQATAMTASPLRASTAWYVPPEVTLSSQADLSSYNSPTVVFGLNLYSLSDRCTLIGRNYLESSWNTAPLFLRHIKMCKNEGVPIHILGLLLILSNLFQFLLTARRKSSHTSRCRRVRGKLCIHFRSSQRLI